MSDTTQTNLDGVESVDEYVTDQTDDPRDLWWQFGWHPWIGLVVTVFSVAIIGAAIGLVKIFTLGGIVAGIVLKYLSSQQINREYPQLLHEFVETSAQEVAGELPDEQTDSFSFITARGETPLLVEPHSSYDLNVVATGSDRIVINQGRKYNLESGEMLTDGRNVTLRTDRINSVALSEVGNRLILEVRTTGGDDIELDVMDHEIATSLKQSIQALIH